MDRLRELDKVAYVRFASVYRKFEDVDEFLHELKTLIGRGGHEGDLVTRTVTRSPRAPRAIPSSTSPGSPGAEPVLSEVEGRLGMTGEGPW